MPNATLVNFAAGETSPRSRGRFDLEWFKASCEKILNWIPEVTGPARYRSGFKHVALTRGGATAVLFNFQLNRSLVYKLEFTDGKLRSYLNGALQVTLRTTLTAVTRANPCVISVASVANLSTNDEIIVTGVVGMEELNGRQVKIVANGGLTFRLVDPVTGNNIDSTNWGAWTSGGFVSEVNEIASPYLEADLPNISFAGSAINGVGYIACAGYVPRKLTVDTSGVFTLATYSRTADPFGVAGATLVVTGITRWQAGDHETLISFAGGSLAVPGVVYDVAAIVGTVELNGTLAKVEVRTDPPPGYTGGAYASPRTVLVNVDGTDIDSSGYAAYTSDGTLTPHVENPLTVAFYEGRLGYFGTDARPNTIFLSRAPDDDGTPRYDDFTGGTADDDACFFALAPVNGQVDYMAWGQGTPKYLFLGTFGGPFRASGAGLDEPITPASINVRQFDSFGCEAVAPVVVGNRAFWIQRGGRALRTAYYDPQVDELVTRDMTINAEHITESPLTRLAVQAGRPVVLWACQGDGTLAGMTVSGSENVAGWHRQKLGGDGEALDVAAHARTDLNDQVWIVARRTVDGVSRCAVEIMADDVTFPDRDYFYTGEDNEDADEERYRNAVWRRQEEYIHLDSAATYNGSDRGVAAAATLTISDPDAAVDDSVTLTASAAVFRAGDVGKEIWVKPDRDTGEGGGRATITAFTSTTSVTATVDVVFEQATAAAGDWYFATDTIYGAWHLEGQVVGVVGDGGVISDGGLSDEEFPQVDIENGRAALPQKVAVAHIGIPYEGVLKSHNLELSDGRGPAQAKPRNIFAAFVRFLSTLGVEFGTDIYDLQKLDWRSEKDKTDRPSPVFSGIKEITNRDGWSRPGDSKHVIIRQRLPLPAVVQFVEARYDVSEGNS